MNYKSIYIYVIYPIATIVLALQAPLTQENLTFVRTLSFSYFFIWVIGTLIALGMGFYACLQVSLHKEKIQKGVIVSAILFIIAIFLPYDLLHYPILSDLHVTFSFIALASMLGCIGLLLISLSYTHFNLQLYRYFYIVIILVAMSLLFYYMKVNSLVEIFLGLSSVIFLDRLGCKVNKK